MKINKIILSLSLVCATSLTFAQPQSREEVVFKAMRDEAARTKTIKMGQMPSPFLLSYYLEDTRSISISSQYGSILSISNNDGSSKIGAEAYIGNKQVSNRLDYSGRILSGPATIDNDYLSLRTTLWNYSDAIYKNALKEYQVKANALQQMTLSDEERAMADFIETPPTKDMGKELVVEFDVEKWSAICNKLSAIFQSYPDLIATSANYSSTYKTFYIFNSEGLELKQMVRYVNLSAAASIQDESGVIMRNSMSIFNTSDSDFPSEEELVKRVEAFAKKMSSLKRVENMKEYYNGPVLFTGGSVLGIFTSNVLGNSGVIAGKGLTKSGWMFNALERRMDKKVIDTKLTIKNLTALKEYKGTKLIGGYEIDADGVRPEKEITLIEKGILKQMLNGSSETTLNTKSTGSTRMALGGREMIKLVAPSILHISVSKGLKEASMKKELLKLAKEEGLKYAYIVHSMAESCPEVYRVDVKSGEQTRIGSTRFSTIDMSSLRRIAAVSSEENVVNTMINGVLMTIIAPKSMILNDIEIDLNKLNKSQQPLLPSPLKR